MLEDFVQVKVNLKTQVHHWKPVSQAANVEQSIKIFADEWHNRKESWYDQHF
jgi:hypothetical protein